MYALRADYTESVPVLFRQLWYDHYLKWDPQDYGGIKNIILPSSAVWMPEDILLVNR
jgi:hypothetical protein